MPPVPPEMELAPDTTVEVAVVEVFETSSPIEDTLVLEDLAPDPNHQPGELDDESMEPENEPEASSE
jgi:hypothetical protein